MINEKIMQAYKQAPWRIQLQWIGALLFILVTGMLISGIYLYLSAQATQAGTQIRALEIQREALQIRIADLSTQLALSQSASAMQARAAEAGYRLATQDDMVYIKIADYPGRQVVLVAPAPEAEVKAPSLIKPAYRESLWDRIVQVTLAVMSQERSPNESARQ